MHYSLFFKNIMRQKEEAEVHRQAHLRKKNKSNKRKYFSARDRNQSFATQKNRLSAAYKSEKDFADISGFPPQGNR